MRTAWPPAYGTSLQPMDFRKSTGNCLAAASSASVKAGLNCSVFEPCLHPVRLPFRTDFPCRSGLFRPVFECSNGFRVERGWVRALSSNRSESFRPMDSTTALVSHPPRQLSNTRPSVPSLMDRLGFLSPLPLPCDETGHEAIHPPGI